MKNLSIDEIVIRYGLINKLLGSDLASKVTTVDRANIQTKEAFNEAKAALKSLFVTVVESCERENLPIDRAELKAKINNL